MPGSREGSGADLSPPAPWKIRRGILSGGFLLRSAPSWPELDSTGIDGSLAVLRVEKYNEPGLVCDLVEARG